MIINNMLKDNLPCISHCVVCLPSDKIKLEIVTAGGVAPLLKLARSRDIRVQRNATGALLNVTHLRKYLLHLFCPW